MRFTHFASLVFPLLLALAPPIRAQEIPLQNADFEGETVARQVSPNAQGQIEGEVAQGWQDNSDWAPVSARYARDTANAHGGAASQRITATRVEGGAVQFVQSVKLRKGHIYEAALWLRGRPGQGATLAVRQSGAPYKEYFSGRVNLAAEWQEARVFGEVTDDADCFIMVRLDAPLTLWVDDVSLRDVTESQSDAAPKLGNLVSGGSFETAQIPFGWAARFEGSPANAWRDPQATIDGEIGRVGRQSLRADIPADASVRVDSPLVEVNYNRPYAASVWLKAAAPGVAVQLNLEGTDISSDARVGTRWQRFTLADTMPYRRWTRLRLTVAQQADKPRTLWIDGAMLEERAAPSEVYQGAAPVELALDMEAPGHVVFDGQSAEVTVSVGGQLPAGARLRRSMVRLDGRAITLKDLALPAKSFALAPDANQPRGMFKLRGQIVGAQGAALSAPVELVWARLPRPKDVPINDSYFGLHVPLAPRYIRIAQAVGVKWTRLHDTSMIGKWPFAEPEPNNWHYYDDAISGTRALGMGIVGMLDGAPPRVSTKPRTAEGGYWNIWNIPDKDGALDEWENYVAHVTQHYRGRIDNWEVWNEPWGNWWLGAGGTPQLYARMSARAHDAAHQANPAVNIIGVDTVSGHDDDWAKPVLKAGGTKSFEAFSFHDYTDVLYGGPDAGPLRETANYRALMNEVGAAKPIWNTEGGSFGIGSWLAPQTGGMKPRDQVAYIVRYDVTMMAAGARKSFLYAMHTDPAMGEIETRVTEVGNVVKPILAARAVLASLVDGAGTPTRVEPVKGVDQYNFANGVSVLWSYDGADHALPVPRATRAMDAMGNALQSAQVTVGAEPIYWTN